MNVKPLSQLSAEDLARCPAWESLQDSWDEEEELLRPVQLTPEGLVPIRVHKVWGQGTARFADGSEHPCAAACWSGGDGIPQLVSVWNGSEYVPLFVPPAPDFVLEKQGPQVLARAFCRTVEQVFPLTVEMLPRFEHSPLRRRGRFDLQGSHPMMD